MINLFAFATDDKSCGYLLRLFGSMNNVVCNPSGNPSEMVMGPVLQTMFQTFNSVILAIGALIIVYVTVVGVMLSAHEGEFMGKKWGQHSLWLPIRMVLGIACLVPISGYSFIQYILMWIIVQGIGAADTLWGVALSAITTSGSPYAKLTVPAIGSMATIQQLYQGLQCDATARKNYADPAGIQGGGYYCASTSDPICSGSLTFPASNPQCSGKTCTFNLGPNNGDCGSLSYCNADPNGPVCGQGGAGTLACAACQGQNTALGSIVPFLANIASQFADIDYAYRDFYFNSGSLDNSNSNWGFIQSYCAKNNYGKNECCVPNGSLVNPCTSSRIFPSTLGGKDNKDPTSPSDQAVKNIYLPFGLQSVSGGTGFLDTAVSEYTSDLTKTSNDWIAAQNQNPQNALSGQLGQAAAYGWIFAGAYYYTIAGMNSSNLANSSPSLQVTVQDPSQTQMKNYRNNYSAASVLIDAAASASSAGGSGSDGGGGSSFSGIPQLKSVGSSINSAMGSVSDSFTNNVSTSQGDNPLIKLQLTGQIFLVVVELLWVALLFLTLILGLAGNIDVWVLGTGAADPVGPAMILVYFVLIPALYGLMGILLTYGGLLAVYAPLIPYVVFTFGAIGWLITTVETMVAGPLVALGILSPSGEHEFLGKSAAAMMLIFNVFLRPSLMIFGLMAAMLLASIVVDMINLLFWTTVLQGVAGMTQGGGVGTATNVLSHLDILQIIIYLGAYIALVVAALNKSFAAIYIIPQKVTEWMGGRAGESHGEADAVGETKQAVGGATSGAKGAMDSSRGGVESGAGKGLASNRAFDAKKNANELAAGNQAKPPETTPPESKP